MLKKAHTNERKDKSPHVGLYSRCCEGIISIIGIIVTIIRRSIIGEVSIVREYVIIELLSLVVNTCCFNFVSLVISNEMYFDVVCAISILIKDIRSHNEIHRQFFVLLKIT